MPIGRLVESTHTKLQAVAIRTAPRVLLRLLRKTQQDDVTGMAAEMAYRLLFSLFPLLLFLVAALA